MQGRLGHQSDGLQVIRGRAGVALEAIDLAAQASLKAVNVALWDTEDNIRLCEQNGDFGPAFVALARSVYQTNDRRAALKREINLLANSAIVEEKAYAGRQGE